MDIIRGIDAIRMAEDATKIGGYFVVAFFPYSRTKGQASTTLREYKECRVRSQLPREKWSIESKNFFLFEAKDDPKMCYRVLIRYIGFSTNGYKLKKVIWYE